MTNARMNTMTANAEPGMLQCRRPPPPAAKLRTASSRQRGAVLMVALLFLVILTMLGLTAMGGTTMDMRMAGNTRDLGVAHHAAEAALRDARRDLHAMTVNSGVPRSVHVSHFGAAGVPGTCNTAGQREGLCLPAAYSPTTDAVLPPAPAVSMTAAPSVAYGTYTGAPAIDRVARQPRYVIEVFCLPQHGATIGAAAPPCKFYRITARGYGGNPNTQVTLQEIFLSL